MMKKLFGIVLALLLVFSAAAMVTGCSKAEEPQAAAAAAPAPAAAEVKAAEAPAATPEPAPAVDPVAEAALAYFAEKADDNNMIAQDAFIEKVRNGEDLFILDIRQADVYAEGHIEGAYNAPWGPAIGESLDFLPDDQPVYVYCYSGQTAGQTVAALNVAGIPAKSVRYGWNLGISKVEGYEDVVSAAPNLFGESEGVKFDETVKAAVVDYFNNLKSDPNAPSNIIPAAKAKELIDASEGDDLVVLSIRQAADYAANHIPGAINIPWAKGMQEAFSTLPKDVKIITYCYSGQTAGQAVAILRLLGYDAASLKSGMGTPVTAPSGWMNEGFPVVSN